MAAKILVVDDTPGNVKLLASLLAGNGYSVVTAKTGAEALERIAADDPDLVLLDVVMPGLSGYDVCANVRADASRSMLPIVLVTTLEAPEERIRGLEAGADDFITKPINEPELLARVRSLLRIKQLYDTVESQAAELADWNKKLAERVEKQVGELDRMRWLGRFVPPQIAERIVNGTIGDPLATHRGDITVIFVDLRGFTAFAETAEPEEVMTVLNQFHREMGEIIERYEGTLERFTGDGLMAFFNDPVPVPDAPERAVRTAIEMRERFEPLSADWRRHGHDLGIGIGIARGYATIGAIGFERRFDYAAIGNVTNLAARLCADAKPGQILVCRRVLSAVESAVDVESLGALALKGFQKPVPAFQICGWKGTVNRAAAPAAAAVASLKPPSERIFRLEGEYWSIHYEGQSIRMKDSKGLRYIAHLLRYPDREFHALDLFATVNVVERDDGARAPSEGEVLGDAGPVLDRQAKAAYRDRLEDLRGELAEAESFNDAERASRARAEMEFLSREVSAAVGIGGKDRRAASAAERARVNVTRTIADSLRRINEHDTRLGRYLAASIKTGTYCAYEPADVAGQAWTV